MPLTLSRLVSSQSAGEAELPYASVAGRRDLSPRKARSAYSYGFARVERGLCRVLLLLEEERAHNLALISAKAAHVAFPTPVRDPRLEVKAFGLRFSNPIGIAAGLDKDAFAPIELLKRGFGSIEVGTATPLPQSGNLRPRVERLEAQRAVINRFGFNNIGHDGVFSRLARITRGEKIIGINLGANKDSADRIGDYVSGIKKFINVVDYFTINISSPNTPGLRDLQAKENLDGLLARIIDVRDRLSIENKWRPILVKISPDLSDSQLDEVVSVVSLRGVDGLVVSNTTVSRPLSISGRRVKDGGLSGRPMFALSTAVLAKVHQRVQGRIPIVGVGGVDSPEAAWLKILAGASIVQMYTSLIYNGLGLVDDVNEYLLSKLDEERADSLVKIVGRDSKSLSQLS